MMVSEELGQVEEDSELVLIHKSFSPLSSKTMTLKLAGEHFKLTTSEGFDKYQNINTEFIPFASISTMKIENDVSYSSLKKILYIVFLIASFAFTLILSFIALLYTDDIPGEIGAILGTITFMIFVMAYAIYSYLSVKRVLIINARDKIIIHLNDSDFDVATEMVQEWMISIRSTNSTQV